MTEKEFIHHFTHRSFKPEKVSARVYEVIKKTLRGRREAYIEELKKFFKTDLSKIAVANFS